MLKVDEKFLYTLLTLSQEQNIKTGRFALIYADEVIISHTNENEYNAFVANRKSEALQDRIIMIKVPYNLKVSQEERIYDKLLKQSQALRNDPHRAEHAEGRGDVCRNDAARRAEEGQHRHRQEDEAL